MRTERIYFKNEQGEQLSARLERPIEEKPLAYALFAHCFTCGKNLNAVRIISRELASQGIAVLRFDFTGLGQSEDDFTDTNFSSNVSDLLAAARFLTEQHEAPQLLVGHSLGGAAVLYAAVQLESVKAVATIGAPFSSRHVQHLFGAGISEIEARGEASVRIGGRAFRVKKQFLEDIAEKNSLRTLNRLKAVLLLLHVLLHAPEDQIVGIDNAASLYKAASQPKSFVALQGADHLLSERDAAT